MGELTGALGIEWYALAWQLAAFLVLLFVLRKYAFGPVTRILDERASRIRSSIETAERVQREMQEMEQRSRKLLEDSRRQGQQIVQQAQQAADRIQTTAQDQAKIQANEIVARSQVGIDRAKNEAMEDLRHQVADLAIAAASRVVRRELDPNTHVQLINDVLAESGRVPGADSPNGGRPVA